MGSTQRQPVTLYITVTALANATAPDLTKSLPNTLMEGDHSPAGENTTIPGPIQFTVVEPPSSPSHQPSIENEAPMQLNREEMSPTVDPLLARRHADEAMKTIDQSKTWESVVKRISWVMDKLSPFAEVRTMPLLLPLTKLISTQLFPHAKMAHSLLSAIPKVRPFASYSKQGAHAMFVWMIDNPATVST